MCLTALPLCATNDRGGTDLKRTEHHQPITQSSKQLTTLFSLRNSLLLVQHLACESEEEEASRGRWKRRARHTSVEEEKEEEVVEARQAEVPPASQPGQARSRRDQPEEASPLRALATCKRAIALRAAFSLQLCGVYESCVALGFSFGSLRKFS